jgi:hypothetical protein
VSEDPPLPNKLDVARALMLKGSVFIHLDPRVDEVSVPPWLRNQPQLVLQVGLEMALPIRDLVVDENGVQATLSFNRSPFLCVVPWASVFALVGDDGRGLVWPESMPVEIAAEVDREARRHGPRADTQGDAGAAGKSEEGGRVERIVGRAVRQPGVEPKRSRGLRSAKKVSRIGKPTEATVSRLDRMEPKPSAGGLQLIRGHSAGGGSAGSRVGARGRKKPSHLRVVK